MCPGDQTLKLNSLMHFHVLGMECLFMLSLLSVSRKGAPKDGTRQDRGHPHLSQLGDSTMVFQTRQDEEGRGNHSSMELYMPQNKGMEHPLKKRLRLRACRVSGNYTGLRD